MKKLLLIAVLPFLSFLSFGQTNPDELVAAFFKEYAKNPANAVEFIYATNPWTVRVKDRVEGVKQEVNKYTIDYMGKYFGYELITRKQFSESLVLLSHMVKYDRQPLRFLFTFYKPNDKWILFSFKIDGDLDDELEQAAKLYYLNLDRY